METTDSPSDKPEEEWRMQLNTLIHFIKFKNLSILR